MLRLQYDGTAYHGWQTQANAVTVQEELSKALKKITGERVNPEGCSRTDAGVHAEEFVCNFMTASSVPADRFPYALNANLPSDIVCLGAGEAGGDFHANRSALGKRYIYRILNREFPDAALCRYAWHYRRPLDVRKMREAARAFVGRHDFAGFASSGCTVKTTVREIYSLDVRRENDIIIIDVKGNGFLYNMVRIIAGTLVYVGGGRIDPRDLPDIIESCDRKRAGITAPARGLCLKEVYYR